MTLRADAGVLGHSLDDVVRPLDGSNRGQARNELERTGQSVQETRQLIRGGITVAVRASVDLIRDESGQVTGIVAVNRPIDAADGSHGR